MTKQIGKWMVVMMGAGLLALAGCSSNHGEMSLLPRILMQPFDTGVKLGETTILSVKAANADRYQWLRNGVPIAGETNATLRLENVKAEDAANYSCQVYKGDKLITTRTASITAYSLGLGGSFCVYATATTGSGTVPDCGGTYAGYVVYQKTAAQGWGWAPSTDTTVHTATDTNRTDTKIRYLGKSLDHNCAQTSVTVPDPCASIAYRFTIYFPNNVPTNTYCITLSGFDP